MQADVEQFISWEKAWVTQAAIAVTVDCQRPAAKSVRQPR
jgi:hypothetical protein